jgi:hypothetical protein
MLNNSTGLLDGRQTHPPGSRLASHAWARLRIRSLGREQRPALSRLSMDIVDIVEKEVPVSELLSLTVGRQPAALALDSVLHVNG